MNRYDLLIFDFDGTLVDTAPDITDCVNEVLARKGHGSKRLEEVKEAIGKGVRELMIKLLAPRTLEAPELEALVRDFKQHYAENLVRRSKPYPGVMEALSGPLAPLRKAIVTNKPHAFTVQILRELAMDRFFECVVGMGLEFPPKPDPAGMREAMKRCGGAVPERTLFIGDSSVDLATARNAATDFAWVNYGYEDLSRLAPPLTFTHASEWRTLANGHTLG